MEPEDIDDAELAAVLAALRELRLQLSTDLSLASGAVESDEPEIAAEILAADRDDLQRFVGQAAGHLSAPTRLSEDMKLPQQRRRRLRRVLTAVPAVGVLAASATAAALIAPRLGASHPAPARATPPVAASQPAVTPQLIAANLHQLRTVIDHHSSAQQVIAAADRLHTAISQLIAHVGHDPQQVAKIAHWLRLEQSLIAAANPAGGQEILKDSRRLVAHLMATASPILRHTGRPVVDGPATPSAPATSERSLATSSQSSQHPDRSSHSHEATEKPSNQSKTSPTSSSSGAGTPSPTAPVQPANPLPNSAAPFGND